MKKVKCLKCPNDKPINYEPGLPIKCPVCGNDQYPEGFCDAVPERIILSDGISIVKIHKAGTYGRTYFLLLRVGHEYISSEQIEIIKTDDEWKIRGLEGTVNSTYLNNKCIDGREEVLHSGDSLFIGNISTKNGLELKVDFE